MGANICVGKCVEMWFVAAIVVLGAGLGCGGSEDMGVAQRYGDRIPALESEAAGKGDGGQPEGEPGVEEVSSDVSSDVSSGGEAGDEVEEADEEPISVRDERAHRCRVTCFKVMWCGGSDEAIVSCVELCEASDAIDVVAPEVLGCLERAERCVEVDRCHRRLEICDDVCGAKHHCGQWEDAQGDCHLWCAEEVWAGRLTRASQDCVSEQARGMHCDALDVEMCGLQDVVEGAYYGD